MPAAMSVQSYYGNARMHRFYRISPLKEKHIEQENKQ